MVLKEIIRKIASKYPNLNHKLKLAGLNQSPFQYIFQTIALTGMICAGIFIFIFILFSSSPNFLTLLIGSILAIPLIYLFLFSIADVKAKQLGRELDRDLLFVSEYLLVTLESGIPLPNALEEMSKIQRPGGIYFERILREFKMGEDLEQTLDDAIDYCPSEDFRNLIKKLRDSLSIGVQLDKTLVDFVEESSDKKLIEIQGYSKKLNPLIMMYLVLGIVVPSLGVTFFILFAAISGMSEGMLAFILSIIFLFMFLFQYIAYSSLKFSKSTL
ncbi:MAG: type II secretion system F family protein [Nanoarchaeota archaeon]|nr:type II secretion system F family protein [Nanoarchaeota archaeon]